MLNVGLLATLMVWAQPAPVQAEPAQTEDAVRTLSMAPEFGRLFRERLIDPSSAVLRDVRLHDGGLRLCGYVNSKNRVGGYVGWRRFSAFHFPPYTILEIEDPSKPYKIIDCREQTGDRDYSTVISGYINSN